MDIVRNITCSMRAGMQHGVIRASAPYGLGLEQKLLPEILKSAGYATHLIGKWHLGYFQSNHTPTHRGFDSHFGYWSGKEDYWDHCESDGGMSGLDFRDGMRVVRNATNLYSTDLFTDKAVEIIEKHAKYKIGRKGK